MNGCKIIYAAALLSAVMLASCTVGPNFDGPPTQTSAPHFGAEPQDVASRTTETKVDEAWWKSFGDPKLTSLVERLARQNLDLQTAAERVVQARAVRRVAAAQGLPQISGRASYVHERESANGTASLVEPAPGAPLEFDLADVALQASWEIDLFGRVRRAVESANANTTAAIEARHDVALAAIADLAETYMALRGTEAREAVVQHNLDSAIARRKLVGDRLRNGIATLADVAQADAEASAIGEDLPTLRAAEARQINALGLLLAEPPRTLEGELKPASGPASVMQPLVPPTIPMGLPGDLLRRRPDIREAEARLHAATAQSGVAVADFFPDISLTGNYGYEALGTNHLFDAASRMFMVGPTVSLPIFEGGRLRAVLQLRRSEEREAAIAYRQAVLQAWHDVDNALTAYAEVQHRRQNVTGVVHDDEVALRIADQRYQQGADSYIDMIAAQAAVFRSQDALAQTQTDLETDLVRLYRALGGGWSTVDTTQPKPPLVPTSQ